MPVTRFRLESETPLTCFLAMVPRFDQKSKLVVSVGRLVALVVIVKFEIVVCEAQFPVVTVNRWPATSSTTSSSENMS